MCCSPDRMLPRRGKWPSCEGPDIRLQRRRYVRRKHPHRVRCARSACVRAGRSTGLIAGSYSSTTEMSEARPMKAAPTRPPIT